MRPATARNITIKSAEIGIETLHVKRGQWVTVWLDGVQVELRVTGDGKREIFFDFERDVDIVSFDDWTVAE